MNQEQQKRIDKLRIVALRKKKPVICGWGAICNGPGSNFVNRHAPEGQKEWIDTLGALPGALLWVYGIKNICDVRIILEKMYNLNQKQR